MTERYVTPAMPTFPGIQAMKAGVATQREAVSDDTILTAIR